MSMEERIGGVALDLSDPANVVAWQARWIKDPLFANVPFREMTDANRCEANNGPVGLRNVHTLVRRSFTLPKATVASAKLFITADDCYKLYVNGAFVGTGPAPSYPFSQPYNGWDGAEFLRPGEENVVGVHVYYQGLHNLAFVSADNLQGLLAQLDIRFADGRALTLATDGSWRSARSRAYAGERTYGYQTQFSEDIDLRQWAPSWNRPGFDDAAWESPAVCDSVPAQYTIIPQWTPPVAYAKVAPVRIVRKAPGRFFIDFGSEIVGETSFVVTGPAGHRVEVRHAEELSAPDEARYDIRANCCYQEFCTLSGRVDDVLEFFDYKGFRYVEVLNWPEDLAPGRVCVKSRHYPFPEDACAFRSSSERADRIWRLCANGVKQGTLDTYLDCPTREKGGFLGDAFVTGQSHLLLTGDARILRKFLRDVADSGRISPGLLSVAPTNCSGELAEYSFLMPELLDRYLLWTGDLDFARSLQPAVDAMLEYYRGYENDAGLLQNLVGRVCKSWSVLVDWPPNLRDDYDDLALLGAEMDVLAGKPAPVNTVANAFYFGALTTAASLADACGRRERGDELRARAKRLRGAMQALRDPATRLFVDRPGSRHSSLHANAIALKVGLVDPTDAAAVVEHIARKRLSCGVYFSYFVLKGLCSAGRADLAWELITSDDERSWQTMLDAGATTCMEAWGPEQKWNTSWCHPWSSAPISIVATEILGLSPAAGGWSRMRFAPQTPGALESAELKITTPRGPAGVRFRRKGDACDYTLSVPPGCEAECEFAGGAKHIVIDGRDVNAAAVTDSFGVTRLRAAKLLGAGVHEIRVARASA